MNHITLLLAFCFPNALNVQKMVSIAWDETETAITGNVIELTGSPAFIKINAEVTPPVSVSGISMLTILDGFTSFSGLKSVHHPANYIFPCARYAL